MRKFLTVFLVFCICFFSCETVPNAGEVLDAHVEEPKEIVEEPLKEPIVVEKKEVQPIAPEHDVIAEFGEVKITKKDYNDTMEEIKIIVKGLNETTAKGDYSKWLTYLSESYKKEYSKASTLKATVDNLKKKNVRGLKLSSLKDYFTYVFVAARQNIRVDDIEFLSPVRVNVLMTTRGKKLLVYDLEKINNHWLLVPSL